MGKKIVSQTDDSEKKARLTVKQRKILYIVAWGGILFAYFAMGMFSAGFDDNYDVIFAIMMFIVPIGTLVLDFLNFLRYEKAKSASSFVLINCLIVFMVSYIGEALTVIIGFGLDTPQYKLLYSFALGFSLFAAFVSLFISGFYGKATGIKIR